PHLALVPSLVSSHGRPSCDRRMPMHRARSLPQLPSILAGVSLAAESLLRCAGLPCVRIDQQQAATLSAHRVPGRIALYESTRPQSNAAKSALSRLGLAMIDISRLTDPAAARPPHMFADAASP